MTLADLVATLERRAREAEQVQAHAPVSAVLSSVLADLRPLVEGHVPANGNGSPATPTPDRLLTAEEAAPRLGVSVAWLYRHARRLPFTRKLGPRTLRFSEAGLVRYLERR